MARTPTLTTGPERAADRGDAVVGPTWARPTEAVAVVLHPRHLRRTLLVAALVGLVLFGINQLDVVMRGEATTSVWVKGALTFVVPFAVSNYGILAATHRRGH